MGVSVVIFLGIVLMSSLALKFTLWQMTYFSSFLTAYRILCLFLNNDVSIWRIFPARPLVVEKSSLVFLITSYFAYLFLKLFLSRGIILTNEHPSLILPYGFHVLDVYIGRFS